MTAPIVTARRELTPMPERIARLPLDARGYPIPWFVAYVNGAPEFRAMDPQKWLRAARDRLCWVCGGPLGAYLAFVIGPMCGVNRTTSEPACHLECAQWSAINCPFLSRPHMVRREDAVTNGLLEHAAGIVITRNPGATAVWVTRTYTVFRDPKGRPLIQLGDPVAVHWYAEGRLATRAEVDRSIETGYPLLLAEAEKERDQGAVQLLESFRARLAPWLPPEAAS